MDTVFQSSDLKMEAVIEMEQGIKHCEVTVSLEAKYKISTWHWPMVEIDRSGSGLKAEETTSALSLAKMDSSKGYDRDFQDRRKNSSYLHNFPSQVQTFV